LQQQSQQTGRAVETLAGKLQAAAASGDQNAREWLLDLKELALAVHQEEGTASQVMQSIHQLVDNHVQQEQFAQPQYQQPQYQQPMPQYQQPVYQQQPYPQQGGGMLSRFLGGSFGSAIATGAGFGIGEDLINDVFR
jgi:hypothetical protein